MNFDFLKLDLLILFFFLNQFTLQSQMTSNSNFPINVTTPTTIPTTPKSTLPLPLLDPMIHPNNIQTTIYAHRLLNQL